MTDQVNPTGSSLASALSVALMAAAAPKALSAKTSSAKTGNAPGSPAPSAQQHAEAVAVLNHHLQMANTNLKFQVDEATGRTFFQVVNENSGEVVLQVPSAEALAMARNLRAVDEKLGISGLLVNKEG